MSKVLSRSLDILFALSEAKTSMSVEQLANKVNIPISTVYRLLQQLTQVEMIRYCENGSYSLGLKLVDLGRAARRQIASDLTSVALPLMQTLTDQTGETTILTVPSASGAVCLEAVISPKPIRVSFEKGLVLPYHAGASAITLLAFLDPETVQQVLEASKDKIYAGGDHFSIENRKEVLEQIRRNGFAITRGEVDLEATGIGVPVFDDKGKIIAALTIVAPTHRCEDSRLPELVRLLMDTSHRIQETLHRLAED